MTQEDKQLLLKDLCAGLLYGVNANISFNTEDDCLNSYPVVGIVGMKIVSETDVIPFSTSIESVKPYLRPMSSMTDEEKTKIASMAGHFNSLTKSIEVCFACLPVVDYCYSRHLDIHGLIEKGLAIEAPEGMYKNE